MNTNFNLNINDYYTIVKEKSMNDDINDIKEDPVWRAFSAAVYIYIARICRTAKIYQLINALSEKDPSREIDDYISEAYVALHETISRGDNRGTTRLLNILKGSTDVSSFCSKLFGFCLWHFLDCSRSQRSKNQAPNTLSLDQPIFNDNDDSTTLGDITAAAQNDEYRDFENHDAILLIISEKVLSSSRVSVADAAFLYSLLPTHAKMQSLACKILSPEVSRIDIVYEALSAVAYEFGVLELLDIGNLEIDNVDFDKYVSFSEKKLTQTLTQLSYRKRSQLRSERSAYSL